MALIQPRTLKGFRDYLPAVMIPREQLMETARNVFRSYGFAPIDTPTLEHLEILSGKGSEETDRQIYRFKDNGKRDVGMRFDLTVPLARFAAQHIQEIGTPFKRYHIAPVWRGENTQAGRYREFMQCDFDTIGTEAVAADIETGLVINELLQEIGIREFCIRINNRQILNGLLEKLELEEKSTDVLRALDKLDKVGAAAVEEEMTTVAGIAPEQASQVLKFAQVDGSREQVLDQIDDLVRGSEIGEMGVERLRQVASAVQAAGVDEQNFRIDVSIARGLDYYTGVIFETILTELPRIGSVCSGGRYDNLAEVYTKQHLPGIGASLGLDRLLAALEALGRSESRTTPAQILVTYFDQDQLNEYIRLASCLRSYGFCVELYPEAKKLGAQLKYADGRGFRIAIIAGSQEIEAGTCQVKDLTTKASQEVPWKQDPEQLVQVLGGILKD